VIAAGIVVVAEDAVAVEDDEAMEKLVEVDDFNDADDDKELARVVEVEEEDSYDDEVVLEPGTVQGFCPRPEKTRTVYMLCYCQVTGEFTFFARNCTA